MERLEQFKLIMEHTILLEHHREELKEKRGFSDQTIKTLQLRSSGLYIKKIPELQHLPQDVLGVLSEDRILIPYLNPDGSVYHLRPHKYGFPNAGIHVYVPFPLLKENKERLILAESEFKAAASCLLGIPAIGIPGISSFSRKHFPQLLEYLETLGCKELIVCFDNEVKDDPNLPNFKADFRKRYDTMIYEYIMAYSVSLQSKHQIVGKIARLKDEWRVQGKADIDGCLAKGIFQETYKKCIEESLKDPESYRKSWKIPMPHRSFVHRRIDRFFYRGPIQERFLSYHYVETNKEGAEIETKSKKITNFVLKVAYTILNNESIERLCRFESNYGSSNLVTIKPEHMVSKMSFQKLCYELGDYEFSGKEDDLQKIWNYLFIHQDGTLITKIKFYGYDKNSGIWFFANGAYYKEKYYKADDEEKIVWIDDCGYKLPNHSDGFDPPILSPEDTGVSVSKIYHHFSRVIDAQYAKLIIGWTLGNFFMPEIIRDFNDYPFLFFYGKQQGGKSTFAKWISFFFGFKIKGVPFSGSSTVGILRGSSMLSMIPLWLEEYRKSDPDLPKKNNLLRNIFDRSVILKGTRKEDEIKTYQPISSLILSGEETPEDSATNSRCILIPIFKAKTEEDDPRVYRWLEEHAPLFNGIGHDILINKSKYWEQVKRRIQSYLDAFQEQVKDTDRRSRLFMSITGGICDVFLGEDTTFTEFIGQHTQERSKSVDAGQALYVFIDDIINAWGTGKIDFEFIKFLSNKNVKGEPKAVAFYFQGCYMAWESICKAHRKELPASKTAILEHLKTEKYFIRIGPARFEGKTLSAVILDYEDKEFPVALKNVLTSTEETKNFNSIGARYEKESEIEADQPVEKSKLVFGQPISTKSIN